VAAGAVLGGPALAAEILEGSPTSARISLRLVEETRGIPDPVDAVSHPTTAFDDLIASENASEGPAAFAQRAATAMAQPMIAEHPIPVEAGV
jgi:acetyl-CoA C-acetyltransferase